MEGKKEGTKEAKKSDHEERRNGGCTLFNIRMSHRKWRETKQQPIRARSGHQITCCLVSLHFLCDILTPNGVYKLGKGLLGSVDKRRGKVGN